MTAPNTLPINRLINVSIVLTPLGAQQQNLSNALILGASDVIDVVQRMRTYFSLSAVASDFGTSAPEYLAAALWFGQSPQPTQLSIGKWAQSATSGKLMGGVVTAANQLLSAWTGITSGGFKITINGTLDSITGLNFSSDTTMAGIAATIQTGMASGTCTWNAIYQNFIFESGTTGASSTMTFLTAAASGTDISHMLAGLSTDGGYVVPGQVAESALTAVTLFDTNFGQQWYALVMPTIAADSDHTAVAGFINAATNKHIYGVTTSEGAVLTPGDTTDVAYLLQQLGYNRSLPQYSSFNAYAVCSALAKLLTVNYNQNNSVIALMYQQEPGVTPEVLTGTQITALEAKNCNVFVSYNNGTSIFEPGVMSGGTYADVITNTDWLAVTLQTSLYNLLYTSPTKIPQTDAGTHLLVTDIEDTLSQAAANGMVAPGTWNSGGFGAITLGSYLSKGWYVYAPPVSTQTQAARLTRASVPIQVAIKLAGAIQDVAVTINVNQ